MDDVKELQVRVKLDHPVLQHRHWQRLLADMKDATTKTVVNPMVQFPDDIGLDQSRMLVIQAALLCTSFLLHAADSARDMHETRLDFPRHDCEKDMNIDICTLTRIVLVMVKCQHGGTAEKRVQSVAR